MTATMSVMTTMEKQMQKWLESEVGRLATQYKFNKKEAMSYLRGEIERVTVTETKAPKAATKTKTKTKTVKKSDNPDLPQPDLPLPYCGEGDADRCHAVVLNHQMFTQCTHRHSSNFAATDVGGVDGETHIDIKLCKGCFKSAEARSLKGATTLTYGTIAERLEKGGVIGNNGALRKPVPYANVMAKLGITEEQAIAAAQKMGVTIPEEEIHPTPVQRGRPKKTKAVEVVNDTSDSGSSGSDKSAAKKRGRPKKEKKVLSAAAGDDLIASLVQEAQEESGASTSADEEAGSDTSATSKKSASGSEAEGVTKALQKEAAAETKKEAAAEKAEAAAAKKAEKAEAARVKKAEAEEVKLARVAALVLKKEAAAAVKEAAKVGKALAAEEKKAAKKAATAAKKAPHAAPPPVYDVAELEVEAEDGEQAQQEAEDGEQQEEEETQVVKWECPADSKTYLKASDNVLYDAESHDAVGVWNEKENKIDELPAEDDEE